MRGRPRAKPNRKADVTAAPGSVCLPFPIRPDFLAQIVIPRDLSQVEADRLCAFVKVLALPDDADKSGA